MRKTILITGLAAALSALLVLGCGTNNGPAGPSPVAVDCAAGTFEFQIHLTGYGDDVGQLLELRAFEAELDENREFYIYGTEVDSLRVEAIPSEDFSVSVCLQDSQFYLVELYADHDGDRRFSAAPADHVDRLGFVPFDPELTEMTAAHPTGDPADPYPHLEWP